jgi:hypothetical protein
MLVFIARVIEGLSLFYFCSLLGAKAPVPEACSHEPSALDVAFHASAEALDATVQLRFPAAVAWCVPCVAVVGAAPQSAAPVSHDCFRVVYKRVILRLDFPQNFHRLSAAESH